MIMSMHICAASPMDYRTLNHCACCGNDLTNVADVDCPYCTNIAIRVPGRAAVAVLRHGLLVTAVRFVAFTAVAVWIAALIIHH